MNNTNDKNLVIVYDCQTKSFFYPDAVSRQLAGRYDTRPIWQIFKEDEVTTAGAADRFVFYYQPQYNHSTGMLVGAEALVR